MMYHKEGRIFFTASNLVSLMFIVFDFLNGEFGIFGIFNDLDGCLKALVFIFNPFCACKLLMRSRIAKNQLLQASYGTDLLLKRFFMLLSASFFGERDLLCALCWLAETFNSLGGLHFSIVAQAFVLQKNFAFLGHASDILPAFDRV